jgi:hypothetical protein
MILKLWNLSVKGLSMFRKVIIGAFLIASHFGFAFVGMILIKKSAMPIASCNVRLHKMQDYYLDNIYHKFGVKAAKDERKNIEAYCYVK